MSRAPAPVSPLRPLARRGKLLAAAAAAIALATLATLFGRTAPPAPQAAEERAIQADSGPRPRPAVSVTPAAPPAATAAPLPAPLAPAVAAPAPRAAPSRELVALVTEEARRSLEQARPEFLERCPPGNRSGGAAFTFNVTFDASGREIARGISEDRRFRAPEVARCLRKLPIGALRVNSPGVRVGVRLSMNVP